MTQLSTAQPQPAEQPSHLPPHLPPCKAVQSPSISLTKTANPATFSKVGQLITYTFGVSNTGNVTVSHLAITDSQAAPAGPLTNGPTCNVTTLAPTAKTTCTAQYTATQADLDHGSIHDQAIATGTPPTDPSVTSNAAAATVTAVEAAVVTPAVTTTTPNSAPSPSSSLNSPLPFTGAQPTRMLETGVTLILSGATLLWVASRRKRPLRRGHTSASGAKRRSWRPGPTSSPHEWLTRRGRKR